MFRCFMKRLAGFFDSCFHWSEPWDSTQDKEFREWMYRQGFRIKNNIND